jgi:predicted enzyme related to lactoylglutathione lyase
LITPTNLARLTPLALLLALLLALGPATSAANDKLPPLPPLNNPATDEVHEGKFIWADLFSNDLDLSIAFYEQLFGWEFRLISQQPEPYGIFSFRGYDLAGLGFRDMPGDDPYARWIHYVSVKDVDDAEAVIEGLGGRTLLRRNIAERGEFAIFASASEVLFGVMRSDSGDPPDTRSLPGEWLWRQLYTWDLDASLAAMQRIAGYQIAEVEESGRVDRIVLSGGYARAGLKLLAEDSDAGPTWLGFIRAEDTAALAARVERLGGQVYFLAESGDMAIVADPGGALLGLVEYEYPEPSADAAEAQIP